jgi:hypothetical protein
MDQIDHWLKETKARATLFSEAYRLSLSRLWWANLMFVVTPAVFSTAAAIFAAVPNTPFKGWLLPPASVLAGLAAVLIAIHKALKCDEYQAECLRLSQLYQGIADATGSALSRPEDERASLQQQIAKELRQLTEGVKARLATRILSKAEMRCGTKALRQG